MKLTAEAFARLAPDLWKSMALVAIASWALAPQSVAGNGDDPFSSNGDTVGSHPTVGDDGSGSQVADRAVFFIEGPAEMLFGQLLSYSQNGEVTGVTPVVPGNTRLEFAPQMRVTMDMSLFNDPRVSAGFRVASTGGATAVRWDLGTHQSSLETLTRGTQVTLPVTRLRRSGMLDQGLGFDSYHATSKRTRFSVASQQGALVIRQR